MQFSSHQELTTMDQNTQGGKDQVFFSCFHYSSVNSIILWFSAIMLMRPINYLCM